MSEETEPTVVESARKNPDGSWSSDPDSKDGWIVWGGGTFTCHQDKDEAIRQWRKAIADGEPCR